jgi:hypothetical protein
MPTDLGVGDSEYAELLVAPADNTTQAVLTVTAPDGTTTTPAVTGGPLEPIDASTDFQQLWTSVQPVDYTQPGRWVQAWTVTGTGEGAEDLDVYVVASPVAGGPTWLPGRSRIAGYVPHRTLERSVTSTTEASDVYDFTFTGNTVPTGITVDRLITDGAAWIIGRLGTPLTASLYDMAGVVTALYAAAAVERGWPQDDNSLARANDLEKRMDVMLGDLVKANEIATGSGDYGIDVAYPVYSFPPADPRWDCPGYW